MDVENEYGKLSHDTVAYHGVIKLVQPIDDVIGFAVDSTDINVDGTPAFPLWKAVTVNEDSVPERYTTDEVVAAVLLDSENGEYESETKAEVIRLVRLMMVLSLTADLVEWTSRYVRNRKIRLLYAGSVSMEMAETMDRLEEVNPLFGDGDFPGAGFDTEDPS